jgi:hypothetical protein
MLIMRVAEGAEAFHLASPGWPGCTVTPEWARLLDFESTAPEAVERLARDLNQADPGSI